MVYRQKFRMSLPVKFAPLRCRAKFYRKIYSCDLDVKNTKFLSKCQKLSTEYRRGHQIFDRQPRYCCLNFSDNRTSDCSVGRRQYRVCRRRHNRLLLRLNHPIVPRHGAVKSDSADSDDRVTFHNRSLPLILITRSFLSYLHLKLNKYNL